jgi:Cof subfamily protein (haloacid dehalogenase superfamily)
MPLKYRTPEEMTEELSIIKMMMIDEPALLDEIIPLIPESFMEKYTVVKSTPFFLEILNKEVHKGAALERLATHLGLDRSEVMALGDNENDVTMIEYAGLGIAMANATENVKNAADIITASNDEHGVAEAIKQYILNN